MGGVEGSPLHGFLALVSLMTRIPAGGRSLEDAGRHFYLAPYVGLITGVVAWLTATYVTYLAGSARLGAIAYLLTYVAFTGGIHVDGFTDFMEASAVGAEGRDALRIMKDPRKGVFGILVLTLNVITTYAMTAYVLNSIIAAGSLTPGMPAKAAAVLAASHAASAEAMFVAASAGLPEPYEGMGRPFVKGAKRASAVGLNLAVSLSILIPYTLIPHGVWMACALTPYAVSCVAGAVVARAANRRLGFVNGDVLGTAYEFGRLVSLAALTALAATHALKC